MFENRHFSKNAKLSTLLSLQMTDPLLRHRREADGEGGTDPAHK